MAQSGLTFGLEDSAIWCARWFSRLFGCLGVVLAALSLGDGFWVGAVPELGFAVGLPIIGVRYCRQSVSASGDVLVVRNTFRTRQIARSAIERFSIDRCMSFGRLSRMVLVHVGGVIPIRIGATESLPLIGDGGQERDPAALKGWLD